MFVSMLIIKWYSNAMWGSFSTYLYYTSIIVIVTGWGNREYLMREFSKAPSNMGSLFYRVLNARWILLIIAFILTFLLYPISEACIICLWILALHVTQSIEVLLNFKRNFLSAILIEFGVFLLLIFYLYKIEIKQLYQLITLYSCYHLLRSVFYLILFRNEIKQPLFSTEPDYLKHAYVFFLLGIIGFLQSRIDFLIFTFFADASDVAVYQVISAYFILIHAVGTLIVLPFVKNIYRMTKHAVLLLQQRIVFAASILVLISLVFLYVLNTFIYHFNLSASVYLLGAAIVYPPYFYVIKIFQIYKYNQQKYVLQTGLIAILINSIIAVILLTLGKGITAVLIASAVAQIYTAWSYHSFKLNKITLPTD